MWVLAGRTPQLTTKVCVWRAQVQILCRETNPPPNFRQALGGSGATTLHIAVQHADTAVCTAVQTGAPILESPLNIVDSQGCTSLFRAVQYVPATVAVS